jgi:hypothetical protein
MPRLRRDQRRRATAGIASIGLQVFGCVGLHADEQVEAAVAA